MTKYKVGDLINWTEHKLNLRHFLAIVIRVDALMIRVLVVKALTNTDYPWKGCYNLIIPDPDVRII